MLFRKSRAPVPADPNLAARICAGTGEGAVGPQAVSEIVDLLPIPVAVVRQIGGTIEFEAVNAAFRRVGLGTEAATSPLVRLLGGRIAAFFAEGRRRDEFDWQFGGEIDARHFRVMLARRVGQRADRCMLSLIDDTGVHRTEESLRREMNSDSLTGLPNRGGFGDGVEATITGETAAGHAVMIVNMNRFSRVNACMGGLAGDELLISVARRIKGALRARDMLARIGGDEFGVLLAVDDGATDALHVAGRIQAALSTPFRLSDFEIRVDCAIGIALGGEDAREPEDLIRHAQFAVKRAKKTGETEVYRRSTFDVVRANFSIETQLRRAIENGEMRLYLQPIWELGSGRITAFEALSRWMHEGREVSPADFIPVAEECGLIVPLGRWAMDESARTIAAWDATSGGDCGAAIAVNLSAIQVQRDDIAALVERAVTTHRIAGRRLTIELTESAIVSDPDRVAVTLNALKDLGARIAMDDFGTGYSNLALLQRLPIDVLKIDRSFVSGMLADRDKVAIVRAVLSLAQALGMRTTAEGIETVELAQTLAALGCTYGQGYLYAPALPRDDAYALLVGRNA